MLNYLKQILYIVLYIVLCVCVFLCIYTDKNTYINQFDKNIIHIYNIIIILAIYILIDKKYDFKKYITSFLIACLTHIMCHIILNWGIQQRYQLIFITLFLSSSAYFIYHIIKYTDFKSVISSEIDDIKSATSSEIDEGKTFITNYFPIIICILLIISIIISYLKYTTEINDFIKDIITKINFFITEILSISDITINKIVTVFFNIVICIFLYIFIYNFVIDNN